MLFDPKKIDLLWRSNAAQRSMLAVEGAKNTNPTFVSVQIGPTKTAPLLINAIEMRVF